MVSVNAKQSKEIWWLNGAFVILVHIAGLLSLFMYSPSYKTWVLTLLTWQCASLGITMGYHRMWSHRSFKAVFPLRLLLAFMGTLGFQGSIKWWVLRHRMHHRFTDDNVNDPYSAKRGFWFSHIGWIFEKPYYPKMRSIDISDLMNDPIVVFQHKYYPFLAIFSCLVLPTLIGATWNDALGGYLYGGLVARILVWHGTFSINSFAHLLGDQPYSKETTARGGFLLALFTMGEAYHNFHHEFPTDYRNGIQFLDYDPTKWSIWLCSQLGLAYDLKWHRDKDIRKAKILVMEQELQELKNSVAPASLDSLPCMSMHEFEQLVLKNDQRKFLMIRNQVVDVTDFIHQHPGGSKLLKLHVSKDATNAFYGPLNNHTQSARLLVDSLSIATITSKMEDGFKTK